MRGGASGHCTSASTAALTQLAEWGMFITRWPVLMFAWPRGDTPYSHSIVAGGLLETS